MHYILTHHLGLKKYCRKWVPHTLTETQKEQRKVGAQKILDILSNRRRSPFVITGDESWIYTENECSLTYAQSSESVQPLVRHNINSEKVMLSVFFCQCRIMVIDTMPSELTYDANYCVQVMQKLVDNIDNGEPRISHSVCAIHMDNATSHRSRLTKSFLERSNLCKNN